MHKCEAKRTGVQWETLSQPGTEPKAVVRGTLLEVTLNEVVTGVARDDGADNRDA